jgi:hypothetical protein
MATTSFKILGKIRIRIPAIKAETGCNGIAISSFAAPVARRRFEMYFSLPAG